MEAIEEDKGGVRGGEKFMEEGWWGPYRPDWVENGGINDCENMCGNPDCPEFIKFIEVDIALGFTAFDGTTVSVVMASDPFSIDFPVIGGMNEMGPRIEFTKLLLLLVLVDN